MTRWRTLVRDPWFWLLTGGLAYAVTLVTFAVLIATGTVK